MLYACLPLLKTTLRGAPDKASRCLDLEIIVLQPSGKKALVLAHRFLFLQTFGIVSRVKIQWNYGIHSLGNINLVLYLGWMISDKI